MSTVKACILILGGIEKINCVHPIVRNYNLMKKMPIEEGFQGTESGATTC